LPGRLTRVSSALADIVSVQDPFMTEEITLVVVIVCLAVSPCPRASERITELAEASLMNDKALARALVDEERATFMAAWYASSLSPGTDLYGIEHVMSLLNLEYPGMDAIKTTVDSKDWRAAEDALLIYFKNRDYSDLDAPRGSISRADDALAHYFAGNKNQPSGFTGVDPEWPTSGVMTNGKIMADKENDYAQEKRFYAH
jgi:hypothetical protein